MKLVGGLLVLLVSLSIAESYMVCYYGSWAVYRNGNGKFDIEQIDPTICTHLVFGFAGLGTDNKIQVLDPWNELCDNYGKCGYDRFTALKEKNPSLVTTLAVGGWNEGSLKYSNMAKDPSARATFIASAIELLKAHNFDGLDMDWEYPTERGGAPEDKANFVILMTELSNALHAEGMILTTAVSAGKSTIDSAYDVPGLSAVVDLIHVMAYDMHGAWEDYTHHQTILYPYPLDKGDNLYFNIDYALNYWTSLGAPKSKLVVGMATYGRCYRLDNPDDHGMYASAQNPGSGGPYTYSPGMLGYNEICEHDLTSPWTVVNDPNMNEPYAYDFNFGNTWCSYDNPESIATKANYVRNNGYAGLMTWSIETDDFLGKCHSRPFHLIKTMYETFLNGEIPTPPTNPPTSTTTRDPTGPTETTTTPSTTTTKVYPTGNPGSHCSYPGNNPYPYDCTIFYQCIFLGDDLGYSEYPVACAEGSLYNPIAKYCDFDYSVCALDGDVCPNNCPV